MGAPSQMIEIPAEGGTMPCFLATAPREERAPAVIVIQEAFGLNGHIKEMAGRMAAEGYVTLAPDLFWRGGKGRVAGYDELPKAIGLMQSLKDEDIVADVKSAIAYLEGRPDVRADRVGIMGYCMGGRVSFLAACELPDKIKAAAPFYGGGIPIDKTPKLRAPILLFFGGKDSFIPLDFVEQLRGELKRHAKDAEIVVYPDAEHGFVCYERGSYSAQPATDSWVKVRAFFGKHLKG
jgi:carboxymethylenebutenolidase